MAPRRGANAYRCQRQRQNPGFASLPHPIDKTKFPAERLAGSRSALFEPSAACSMRYDWASMRLIFLVLALSCGAVAAADDAKPPEKLTFPSSRGSVIFDHAAHLARQGGHCAGCHDKLFPQSTKQPLKSSEGCRTCHKADGPAFASQGNCAKCHPAPVAAAAKP